MKRSRQWQLTRRPQGAATAEDFALVEAEVPPLGPGQVAVRNTHLSVDPYMRGRMDDKPSYIAPFGLDAPLEGAAVGVVTESRAEGLEPGQVVEHFHGLREVSVLDGTAVAPVSLDGIAASAYLGPLGPTGFTAWLGTTEIAPVREGDTVFVTGAAGAVGSLAGQIARLRGAARVIGSAGGPEKVRYLVDELGFDAAFDYRSAVPAERLASLAPDGIDAVFDNVGGPQLEAAIGRLRIGARIALCGMASQYDGREPYGIANLFELTTKRATARGFIVSDHFDLLAAFRKEVGDWMREGRLVHRESVFDGIEQVPEALLGLLRSGASTSGKVIVRLEV
ncbi:NADP-dependent oxidoreductase [Glycomyces dulcitolivorans]|uniref:NADP-dependent oxidoreductase n=1 Tax=Glycomyces dulcitolivorans TaxID=2200759 RepID=UPI000DD3A847|nr:NADP-dependent oxidoreductase [Glycomyces dulcitolivorans]